MTPRQTLLISGPSGGGKSTLIRQLVDRTLAPEILSRLPAGAGQWPIIEANDVLKGDLSTESLLKSETRPDGWLVHYDIVFIHCCRIKRYEDDPAMDLLGGTDPVTVVFVRPDHQSLLDQYQRRLTSHQKTKSKGSLLWGRYVRRPLRRAMAPFTGKRLLTTAELYAGNKWLAGCYRQWETFLHHLAVRHPGTEIFIVEPVTGPDGSETFRLVGNP
ncbi:MAG: hypothetical protein V4584_08225 [Verrucomicrobiota bacterium]